MKPNKTYTFTSSDVRRGYNSYHEEDELYVLVEDATEYVEGVVGVSRGDIQALLLLQADLSDAQTSHDYGAGTYKEIEAAHDALIAAMDELFGEERP